MAKILAIDDINDNLISLKAIIHDTFPESVVYTALNGSKGIELAIAHNPDVILLDIIMPDMDGFEVCRLLKSDERVSDIPVVFLTALKGDKINRIKALEVGAEGFISKPIEETELIAQIKAMVKIKAAGELKRTEKEKLEQLVEERTKALLQSQVQFKNLFENLQDSYFQTDLAGRFTLLSPSALRMYGYQSIDELLGQPAEQLYFNPKERHSLISILRTEGKIKDYVSQGKKKNGSAFWASMNVQWLWSKEGQIVGTEGMVRDISDRINAERALKESEERFQLLFNQAPLGYQSLNFDGHFIEVNQQWLDTLGYTREEVIGKWFGDFLSPEYKDGFRKRFPLFKAQGFIHSEFEMVHKSGIKLFIAFEGRIGYDLKGEFKQTHCILQDITEKRRAEKALVASEEKYRTMVDLLPDAVVIHESGKFVFANAAALKIAGADSFDQLIERPLMDYVHPDYRNGSLERIKKIYSIGQPSTFIKEKFVSLKGELVDVEVLGIPVIYMGKPAIQTIIRDISERCKAELALQQSEVQFREFFEKAADAIFIADIESGILVDANEAASRLMLRPQSELVGIHQSKLHPPVKKDYTNDTFNKHKEQIKNRINSYAVENSVLRSDGLEVPVEILASEVIFQGKSCIMGTFRDITERKRASEALKYSLLLTESTLESIHNGILVVNHERKVIKTSSRFVEMWQVPENIMASGDDKTLINYILDQLVNPEEIVARIEKLYLNSQAESTDLLNLKDGRVFERVSKPMYLDGKPQGRVWSFLDISERLWAEDKLRENVERLELAMSTAKMAWWEMDLTTGDVVFEKRKAEMLGYSPEKFKHYTDFTALVHPEDYEPAMNAMRNHLSGLVDKYEIEYRIKTLSGEYKWFYDIGSVTKRDSEGRPLIASGLVLNISEHKFAEEAQKESYEFNQSLLKTIPFGMNIVDGHGNILFQNGSFENTFGKNAIGGKCWEFYRDDKTQCIGCPLNEGIKIGETASFESSGVFEGRIFEISHTGMIFKGKKAMLEIFQDITERKKSEQALQESVQLFQGLFNSSPDAIVLIDPYHPTNSWPIMDCNEAACRMNGYTRDEMIGRSIDFLNESEGSREERKAYFKELRQYGTIHKEGTHIHKDGHIFPIEISTSIVTLGDRELVLGIDRDITERKQAERALKESEERYRQFVSQVSEGVYRFESDQPVDINLMIEEQVDFIYDHMFVAECNDAFLKMYGIKDRSEMLGKSHLYFHGGRNNPVNREIMRDFVKNGYHIENAITNEIDSDGKHLVFSNNWMGIIENDHLIRMWGTQFDITEKVKADRVQQMLYSISTAALSSGDLPNLIEFISIELGKLLNSNNFFIAFYDEKTNMLSTIYEKDEKDVLNTWSAEKSATGYVVKNQKSLLLREPEVNKLVELGEIEIYGTMSKVWLGVPLFADKKAVGAIVVQSYDNPEAYTEKDLLMLEFISHQISISIERKKTEQELNIALKKAQESDRLKSAFLANMSHEVRTPLNSIIGFSELMADPDFDFDQQPEFAKIIFNSGNYLLSIISDIMDFSKIEAGQVSVYKLPFVAQKLISTVQKEYTFIAQDKGIELIIDPSSPKEEIWIRSDENRLRQVLTNLVSNAIKFTKEGSVKLGFKTTGDCVKFQVSDTGIGIPEEYHDEIFERFRQVESADSRKYGGNGLGLAISKSLVEMLGGEIWMESVQMKGSTFYFTIPIGITTK